MSARLDDREIARVKGEVPVSSVFASTVKLIRAGREWKACCPFHADRTPSLTINDEKGFYHCFGCGAHGDNLDAAQALHGVGLADAVAMLGGGTLPVTSRPTMSNGGSTGQEPERDTVTEAGLIWRSSVPAPGTPVQNYLAGRGLTAPIPDTIRFARLRYGGKGEPLPCLVALVTSADDRPHGIQRTYLAADGAGKADVAKPKLSLGRVRGGAIRLGPVGPEIVVAEGLEDALSLQLGLGCSAWAAAGASMLPSMEFPEPVRSVVIGRDNDDAGEREARKAACAYSGHGLTVRIMRPEPGFKDFNQQLQGERV